MFAARLRVSIIRAMPGCFNGLFFVDVAINQAEIMARIIEEEMSMGDMMTLLKLRRGRYSLVEEKFRRMQKGSDWQSKI